MDITALQPSIQAASVPFEKMAGNPNIPEKEKVKEAARQFEAVLLRQIIGQARKTVVKSSLNEESNETDIYNDMINSQLADSISRSGNFGLAKSVEAQLVRQVVHPQENGSAPGAATSTTAPASKPATSTIKPPSTTAHKA